MPEVAELPDIDLAKIVDADQERKVDYHPSFITDLRRIINPDYKDIQEVRRNIRDDLRFIHDRFGLQVAMHRRSPKETKDFVHLDKLNLCEAEGALQMIREELIKYPPEYVRNLGIARFRLVDDIWRVGSGEVHGVAFEEGQLYTSIGGTDVQDREALHHEAWHFGDYSHSEFQHVIPIIGKGIDSVRDAIMDVQWAKLNDPEFEYVGDNIDWSISEPKGFAREYGAMSPWEDRATVAEALMTNAAKLLHRGKTDPLLRRKTERIIQTYHHRSHGKMNDHFFQDLIDGKVGEGYWK
jgi:hypothetical protein